MFDRHSITQRIAISLAFGFCFGGAFFFILPAIGATSSSMFLSGVWFLYIIMSLMIGVMGIFVKHPIFGINMHFWMRGAVMGFFFHLLLVLLAYSEVSSLMLLPAVAWVGLVSPFWILIDGVILGIIIDWFATHFAGEGPLPIK